MNANALGETRTAREIEAFATVEPHRDVAGPNARIVPVIHDGFDSTAPQRDDADVEDAGDQDSVPDGRTPHDSNRSRTRQRAAVTA